MNIVQFIFSLFSAHLQLDPNQYQDAMEKASESWDNYTGKFKDFFNSPWMLLALAALLPIAKIGLDKFFERIVGDKDADGDVDLADLLLLAAEKIKNKD